MEVSRRIFNKLFGLMVASPTTMVEFETHNLDKDEFDKAIDRNIVFYDENAKKGEYTSRLRNIMTNALTNPEFDYWKDKDMGHVIKFVICGPNIVKYYKEQKASLVTNDTTLIVGVTNKGKYLLGSC